MSLMRLRVWHMLMLVAACAGFFAVFQYRLGVYDPTSARLRQVRYASPTGKATAIRELIAEEAWGARVVQTLLEALGDSDPTVRMLAAQAMAEAVYRETWKTKQPSEQL